MFRMMLVWVGVTGCSPEASGLKPPPSPEDADQDGLTAEEDCDDSDAAVGGAEVPYDGLDNDCDEGTLDDDLDSDGFVLAEDCDDQDALRGGPEVFGDEL